MGELERKASQILEPEDEIQSRAMSIHKEEYMESHELEENFDDVWDREYNKSDKFQEYLVNGALLTCTQATVEPFIISDDETIELLPDADESESDLKYGYGRKQSRLNVEENGLYLGRMPYATVKDTVMDGNIIPFRCNCAQQVSDESAIEYIRDHLEDCKRNGVCKYLMWLNEEWDNMLLTNTGNSVLPPKYMSISDEKWVRAEDGTMQRSVSMSEGITRTSVLFCKRGGLIVPLTSGQELMYDVAEEKFMWNLVLNTQTGANLITDESNPAHIPLYDGLTMLGSYMKVDLTPYAEARYSAMKITVDYTQIEGNLYRNIHPYRNSTLPESFNGDYHGSFSSGGNTFSMADNRIEIAVRYGISTADGEEYGVSLAGKYIDIELSDGTVLACIMGASKGNEPDSDSNGIVHHDGSIIEFLSCEPYTSEADKNKKGPNKEDILHGEDIVSAYVYSEKRLYDNATKEYTYYFSDGVTE